LYTFQIAHNDTTKLTQASLLRFESNPRIQGNSPKIDGGSLVREMKTTLPTMVALVVMDSQNHLRISTLELQIAQNVERNREREVRAEWELNRGLRHQNRFSGESDKRE